MERNYEIQDTQEKTPQALLVGLRLGNDRDFDNSMEELGSLAEACGMEVAARINSNLRRFYELGAAAGEAGRPDRITLGELCLDAGAMTVTKNGEQIFLTPTEYKILLKLMRSPGRVYTKAQIYESINGEFFENDDKTMMVHVSKLREKIEDDPKNPRYIKTVRGLGYKIEDRK